MYLVFTRRPGKSYHGPLRSLLLRLCDVFQAPINYLPSVLILNQESHFGLNSTSRSILLGKPKGETFSFVVFSVWVL